jgi:uncharacterized membrane protein YcaP (DUF421 family)
MQQQGGTQQQQISLADWQRLLMGDAPWVFLLELLVRAVVVYLLLLLFMRWMGKRVAGQMSTTELAIILSLGAAIGLPLQAPDKGLLPALAVLLVAVAFHRGLSLWSFKSRRVEVLTQGDVGILLKDGRLLPEGMAGEHFSPEKIFASLRAQGVEHLGQLRRVYIEPSGDLSLIKYKSQRPGLLIIPELDSTHGRYEKAEDHYACSNCGNVVASDHEPLVYCEHCGEPRWTEAVTEAGASRAQSARRESAGLARKAG